MKKVKISDILFNIINSLIMLVILFLTLYPFIYLMLYSISNPGLLRGGFLIWPKGFTLNSYIEIITSSNRIPHALLISVLRSTIGPLTAVVITSMAAYTISRTGLIGRKFFLKYFTVTMYFNCGMIPVYLLMKNLGLTGTFWVYIVPYLLNVFNMILVKTYIEALPESLQESAFIDGANDLIIFYRIIFPLCKPVIAAILLYECVNQWNLYSDTMIYNAQNSKLHTLQYVLMSYVETRTQSIEQAKKNLDFSKPTSDSLRMSLTVITIIPVLVVYPFLQKYFAKGLLIGSIKG
jgi:ABC-type sugar transport system, permease component